MPSKFAEVASRNFNPMLPPGLSDEARKAVNAAFDAMSTWRTETVNNSEKDLERVIDKMAAAARALGWPEEIADATRGQMQSITKMQIQMMDQMMMLGRSRSNHRAPHRRSGTTTRCRYSSRISSRQFEINF
jgi:hypothetical protein